MTAGTKMSFSSRVDVMGTETNVTEHRASTSKLPFVVQMAPPADNWPLGHVKLHVLPTSISPVQFHATFAGVVIGGPEQVVGGGGGLGGGGGGAVTVTATELVRCLGVPAGTGLGVLTANVTVPLPIPMHVKGATPTPFVFWEVGVQVPGPATVRTIGTPVICMGRL